MVPSDPGGNPLPGRHAAARAWHTARRKQFFPSLPAAVFLLYGCASTLRNSLALPPARSQRLETAFHSPATTVPLRKPPRRGQRSRPIPSTKFQTLLPARSISDSHPRLAFITPPGMFHARDPLPSREPETLKRPSNFRSPSGLSSREDRSARLAARSEKLTFASGPITLHSPTALISLSN